MATRLFSALPAIASLGWAIFGSWALWTTSLVGHALAFFFFSLSFLALGLQVFGPRRGFFVGISALIVIAFASELLQPRFVSRPAETADIVSDLLGVCLAAVLVGFVALVRFSGRTASLFGALSLVGLLGSVAAVSQPERFELELACRGAGFDPIPSVTGQPIIHIDGATGQLGGRDDRPLGDGILAPDSSDLRCSVLRSGEYSIVATVVPESLDSGGPTRIFTSSIGTDFDEYNTHIGQDFDELSIRIRSGKSEQWESIPGVFAAGERVTVAVTVADGEAHVYVDGELRETIELVGESFVEWDEDFVVMVGDEFTRNRTFEGEIEMVSFFDRALDAERDASVLRALR